MVNDLNESGLSYSTIKKAYEAVSACHRYYRIQTSTAFNPCEEITLPEAKRKSESDFDFFKDDERKQIFEEATRKYSNGKNVYRLGWVFVLLLYSGLRVGELCALTWSDIDFVEKTISITKNAVEVTERDGKGKNRSVLTTQNNTKTKSGTRIIPMTTKAYTALCEIRRLPENTNTLLHRLTAKEYAQRALIECSIRFLRQSTLKRSAFTPCATHSHQCYSTTDAK